MSFCIKDSVVSFIEKDIINPILIRICINTAFFPIYCPQVASQRQSDRIETALHLLLESGSIGIIGVASFY
jgi:hypothetical protein